MSDPHVPSDDTAILRAHDMKFANAQKSFDRACRVCRAKPNRWNIEAVKQAMLGMADEWVAGLERVAGRAPGSWPRLSQETVEAEIGAGMSDRVAVSRRVEAASAGSISSAAPAGCASYRSCSTSPGTALASILTQSDADCASGVNHLDDTLAKRCPSEDRQRLGKRHMPPVDPTIEAGDSA